RCDLHLIAVVHPECPLLLGVRPGTLPFAQPVYVPVGGRRSVRLIVLRCREMRAILDVRQIRVRAGVGQVPGIRSRPHPGLDRQLAGGADAKSRIVAHIVANLDLAVDAVELKINRAGLRSSARTHTHDKDRGPESRGAHDRSVAAHCVCPPLNLSAVFVRLSCSGTTGTAKALERPLWHDSSQESLRFTEILQMYPKTGISVRVFPALLQDRREVLTATAPRVTRTPARGSDLAIFPGIWTYSFCRLLLWRRRGRHRCLRVAPGWPVRGAGRPDDDRQPGAVGR